MTKRQTPTRRRFEIRSGWLALTALAAQLLIIYAGFGGAADLRRFVFPTSYVLLTAFVALNWRRLGFLVIGVGMFLNFLPVVANGGLMPISPESMQSAGLEDELVGLEPGDPVPQSKNVLLEEEDTQLQWLSDRFSFDSPGPVTVFSIGDVIIGAGLIVLALELMVPAVQRLGRRRPSPT